MKTLGLKKRHIQNLVVNSVFNGSWKISPTTVGVVPAGETIEEVITIFLKKRKVDVAYDESTVFKNPQAKELLLLLK